MSPGGDVLLGRPHRVLVERVGHGAAHVGRRADPVGQGPWPAGRAGGSSRRPAGRAGPWPAAWARVELVGAPGRIDDHVVDEHHPLAPVVEGGQLADHRQDGVGMAEVVGRACPAGARPPGPRRSRGSRPGRRGAAGRSGRSGESKASRMASSAASTPPVPLTRPPVTASRSTAPSVGHLVPRAVMVASGLRPTNE